ncbi:hypothetical protein GIB67_016313 [Kingdonia uniflora]|uniref:Uncharacterized protein n=1 Tax=Kingdonia uniflora TaxID=39325 RepID=A0A7J7M9D4_9MAGN|nr:hypothetical protein GIB67_016313 [Kingdonia uniflora]
MQQGLEAKGSDNLIEGLVDHTKDKSNKVQDFDITNIQTQAPVTKDSITSGKLNPSKLNKPKKSESSKGASVPHKKNHDPDLFFKVNGKLYQKLGSGDGGMDSRNIDEEGGTGWDKDGAHIFLRIDVEFTLPENLLSSSSSEKSFKNLEKYLLSAMI